MKFLKKLFNHEYKELKKFEHIADQIMLLDEEMTKLSDKKLKDKTKELRKRLETEDLEDILVEAFAVVREAAYRVIGEKAYYVQILGGLAIHYGNIAEMKTGEGKTLTSTLPAYANALTGKGVHIITVNEYLATRDAEWMGEIYRFLGLTVGVNARQLTSKEKQEQYNCDILYSTNNEIGFDYLRDNMVVKKENRVQRKLNFAIIDEVDSVLIDEARTPLIISGGSVITTSIYNQADSFTKTLKENKGYIYDEQTKGVTLDEEGVLKAEKAFGIDNLYDIKHTSLVHRINQSLKANYGMKKDFDYVVQDGKIVIVDQFTGRLMAGRAFSEGLHQAIEAKENVKINQETKTLATITFQNLFRMYDKLSGMTGTAKTEEEEFRDIYNMYVIVIPTNKPISRIDAEDIVFPSMKGKYKALVEEIKTRNKTGQPILIGTVAVETSELLSQLLKKNGIKHEVLNAKNNEREAEIIANAGLKGAVTIATNMAGRGTDIKLGEGVKELGGLCVIGTERHESRRIDNQLRGRSGRQGDVGYSRFYVSFDDDLMVRFGTDRAKGMLQRVGLSDDQPISLKILTNTSETAQKRVEGNNFDNRKNLLDYDNVVNEQREIIYEKRNEILDNESIHDTILEIFKRFVHNFVYSHIGEKNVIDGKSKNEILEYMNTQLLVKNINIDEISDLSNDELVNVLYVNLINQYENKTESLPKEIIQDFEKAIYLRVIDTHWMNHINSMSLLREGIQLRRYAQENPLRAYTQEGFEMFNLMEDTIEKETVIYLTKAEIRQNTDRQEVAKEKLANDGKEKTKTVKKTTKVGRNDTCTCGSGKKYKNCCGG